jgi:peptidoglycan/xylan/chitin deacetylase (PgdA/CDA1 family)
MIRWLFFLAGAVFGLIILIVTTITVQPKRQINGQRELPDPLIARYSPPGAILSTATASGFKMPGQAGQKDFTVHVPIILYHYIEINKDPKDTIRRSLTVSPYWFDEQAKYLTQNGYTIITLEELVSVINGEGKLPPKPVILTFDDGYRDFYTDVFPILKKYNLKATNFIFPNVLDKKNNMDTWMVKEIINSGLVTIGSHTLSHANLPGLSKANTQKEIRESKVILEQVTGKKVSLFAYPYGAVNEAVIEQVREAGYEAAVGTAKGTLHGKNSLFRLSRIRVGNYAGELFRKILEE